MARFSGSGCLAGAMIAAFAAVEADPLRAAEAALTLMRDAGEQASARAPGPGTFMAHLIDCFADVADHAARPAT